MVLACAMLMSCQNEEPVSEPAKVLSFDIYTVSDASPSGMHRVSTNGTTLTTTFDTGDKAGVFAIKDGQILDNINNLCLTLSNSGVWEPAQTVIYDAAYESAVFYAYFPYSESVTFDPSQADPFSGMVSAHVPAADQSQAEQYNAADLMCSNACLIDELHAVRLPMQHRMALVNIELPNRSYTFTNEGIDPYVIVAPENVQFSLGETAVKPFFDETTQSYLLIVRPQTSQVLNISYRNNGENKNAQITNLSEVQAGEYARYTIHGGADVRTHTLQVGDYLLADGGLLSKDADNSEVAAAKASIVGVVFKLSTTESMQSLLPHCKHAVALSVKEGKAKWSTKGSTSSEENAAGWKTWWTAYGLAALSTDKAANIDLNELTEVGYEYTKAWLAVPSDLELGGFQVPVKDGFETYYTTWTEANPVAAVTTGWYVPSLRDWLNIKTQESALASSLARIDADAFAWTDGSTVYYWSSNIRSAVAMWTFTGKELSSSPDQLFHADTKDSRIYRFITAF